MSMRELSAHELPLRVMDLLGRIRTSTPSVEDQELLAIAMDAMLFITSTGQRYAFIDYLKQSDSDALPSVEASFDTRDEAEAWLKKHPEPPDGAHVLIADEYHHVVYSREKNLRRLIRSPILEHHLESVTSKGLPAPVAAFNTREEAEAWFKEQTGSPHQAVIQIAGHAYLAVHHSNLQHLALHPVSSAEKPGRKDE